MNYLSLALLIWQSPFMIALGVNESGEREIDAIHFPYENGLGNSSSAILSIDIEALTNFTVCFAFMLDRLADVTPSPDTLTFWYMLRSISIYVNFDSLSIEEGAFAPYKWILTCSSFDFVKGNVTLVVNGNEISKGKVELKTKPKFMNMTLEHTRLSISVTKLNMFFTSLPMDLMRDMTSSESPECGRSGDFLTWERASESWVLKGKARKLNFLGPCQRESSLSIFALGFPSAATCMDLCKKLGTRSPPVRTLKEWQNLTKEIELLTANKYNNDLWLAIRFDNKTKDEQLVGGVWRDFYTGEILENYTEPLIKNDDGANFVTMHYVEIETGTWAWQWNRNNYRFNNVGCPCQKALLELRGLCPNSAFRGQNQVRGLQYKNDQCSKLSCNEQSPFDSFFVGGISTKIVTDNEKWKMTAANSDAYAVSQAPENSYVLGKHTWNVFNDKCHNGSYKTVLKLTACKDWEFTCNDGQCISMPQRCDQFPDCQDRSDEKGCQLLVLNEGYNKDVPPFSYVPPYTDARIFPAEVNVSIDLISVMNIDEVDNSIDLKFEIKLEWYDHRLTYNNLKENRIFLNKLNATDLQRIWLPLITYLNTDQFETTRLGWINEWITRVRIIRKGDFER